MKIMELEETLIFIITTAGLLPRMSLRCTTSPAVSLSVTNLDTEDQEEKKFRQNHSIISIMEQGEMAILQLIKGDL